MFLMTEIQRGVAFPKQITQRKLTLTSKPAEPVAREPMVTVVEGSAESRLTLYVSTDLHSALCVFTVVMHVLIFTCHTVEPLSNNRLHHLWAQMCLIGTTDTYVLKDEDEQDKELLYS